MNLSEFLKLCRDAEDLIRKIKDKNPHALKLQGIRSSTLKASALHYLARKRGIHLTLNDLYCIYGKYQPAIIKTKKIIKELDEEIEAKKNAFLQVS